MSAHEPPATGDEAAPAIGAGEPVTLRAEGAHGGDGVRTPGVSGADALRRRYRRWMLCYPPDFRRDRGDDLLTTMVEAAGPDRVRPSLREVANLLGHGLRARVGRPASRTVLAWVLLASFTGGLFGASCGVLVARQALPAPTGQERAATLTGEIAPGAEVVTFGEPLGAGLIFLTEPMTWNLGERDYGYLATAAVLTDPGTVAEGLTAAGWTAGDGGAHRDGLVITVTPGGTGWTHLDFRRTTPWTVWPAGIACGLLAAVGVFLLVAWAARRTGPGHPARLVVTVFYAVSMALLWVSVLVDALVLARHQLDVPHRIAHPLWEWLEQPAFGMLFVVGAAAGLAAVSLATIPGRAEKPVSA